MPDDDTIPPAIAGQVIDDPADGLFFGRLPRLNYKRPVGHWPSGTFSSSSSVDVGDTNNVIARRTSHWVPGYTGRRRSFGSTQDFQIQATVIEQEVVIRSPNDDDRTPISGDTRTDEYTEGGSRSLMGSPFDVGGNVLPPGSGGGGGPRGIRAGHHEYVTFDSLGRPLFRQLFVSCTWQAFMRLGTNSRGGPWRLKFSWAYDTNGTVGPEESEVITMAPWGPGSPVNVLFPGQPHEMPQAPRPSTQKGQCPPLRAVSHDTVQLAYFRGEYI